MRSIWHIIHGDPKFVVGEVQYQSSRWRQPCYVDIENEANELAKASKWIGLDTFFNGGERIKEEDRRGLTV